MYTQALAYSCTKVYTQALACSGECTHALACSADVLNGSTLMARLNLCFQASSSQDAKQYFLEHFKLAHGAHPYCRSITQVLPCMRMSVHLGTLTTHRCMHARQCAPWHTHHCLQARQGSRRLFILQIWRHSGCCRKQDLNCAQQVRDAVTQCTLPQTQNLSGRIRYKRF